MKSLYTIISIALVIFSLTTCTSSNTETEDIEAVIRGHWDSFIQYWEAENADSLATFYASDAQNIPPIGSIKNSKEEIVSFYRMLFDQNISSRYKHEINNIDNCGDLAVETGQFTVDWIRNDSTSWTFKANSMTHWEKNTDGEWKIKALIYNNPEGE